MIKEVCLLIFSQLVHAPTFIFKVKNSKLSSFAIVHKKAELRRIIIFNAFARQQVTLGIQPSAKLSIFLIFTIKVKLSEIHYFIMLPNDCTNKRLSGKRLQMNIGTFGKLKVSVDFITSSNCQNFTIFTPKRLILKKVILTGILQTNKERYSPGNFSQIAEVN